jgi:hypothetical protein
VSLENAESEDSEPGVQEDQSQHIDA